MSEHDEAWEAEISRYLDFLVDSDKEEDLVAVLRAHLYIEIALTELLSANHATAPCLFEDGPTFEEKVNLTKKLARFDKDHRKMLKEIGHLRNRFAHLPIKSAVDEHDIAELQKVLPARIAKGAKDMSGDKFYRDGDPNAPSTKVRIILRVVFNWLSSRAAAERDRH